MINVLLALSVWLNIVIVINLYEYYRLQKIEKEKLNKKIIDVILKKDGL